MKNIKYHPILFSTPMVQAIQENRKGKTRRTKGLEKVNLNPNEWKFEAFGTNPDNDNDKNLHAYFTVKGSETWMYVKCPYNLGNVLWVRENFYTFSDYDHIKPSNLKGFGLKVFYSTDLENDYESKPLLVGKTRPNIFLPKEYARIFLKIKTIRCERLQEISEEDAKQEGIYKSIDPNFPEEELYYFYPCNDLRDESYITNPKTSFYSLWLSINGKESWDWNPFVWVYEFEQIEKPNDFII